MTTRKMLQITCDHAHCQNSILLPLSMGSEAKVHAQAMNWVTADGGSTRDYCPNHSDWSPVEVEPVEYPTRFPAVKHSVACVGPNLMSRDGYGFHVHSADCADRKRPVYRHHQSDWNHPMHVANFQELVEVVYGDIMSDNGDDDWSRYTGEFKIFPCVAKDF